MLLSIREHEICSTFVLQYILGKTYGNFGSSRISKFIERDSSDLVTEASSAERHSLVTSTYQEMSDPSYMHTKKQEQSKI